MPKVDVHCPCCDARITVTVSPGEPPIYYPNDKAYPGSPPEIEEIEGCECVHYIDHLYAKEKIGDETRFVGALERYYEAIWEQVNEIESRHMDLPL